MQRLILVTADMLDNVIADDNIKCPGIEGQSGIVQKVEKITFLEQARIDDIDSIDIEAAIVFSCKPVTDAA